MLVRIGNLQEVASTCFPKLERGVDYTLDVCASLQLSEDQAALWIELLRWPRCGSLAGRLLGTCLPRVVFNDNACWVTISSLCVCVFLGSTGP